MVVLILLSIVVIGYLYLKWNYSYWERRDVYQIEPQLFYGNFKDVTMGKISIGDMVQTAYARFKLKGLKYGGLYEMFKPAYMPIDLEIIKSLMQKDFSHFMNHGLYVDEKADPLSGHLFALEDEKWKKLRAKLTPTFTTGKMKMMFPTMVSCTKGLGDILKEYVRRQDAVDIKEVVSRFTTDIIGSTAFGIDCNSLKNPDSEFRQFGKKIFTSNIWQRLRRIMVATFPKSIFKQIGIKQMSREVEDFFMGAVKSTVEYREKNNIYRKDFMHLLLQLKNKGKVTDDEDFMKVENKSNEDDNFLTLNQVAAQCFVFFVAGFETSSTTITFAILELAQNPDIQEKLRKEINTVLHKYDNQITYEAIMEMSYLDKVVNETLRKHPPVSATPRVCNTSYKVPDTDLIIEKGVKVFIPILGIHRDPEYYPEPNVFDPERFSEKNKANRHQYAFIPFGEGPRICIGSRFGLLQTKVGLVAIIRDFSVTLDNKTTLPIKYSPQASSILAVDGDVWINLETLQ